MRITQLKRALWIAVALPLCLWGISQSYPLTPTLVAALVTFYLLAIGEQEGLMRLIPFVFRSGMSFCRVRQEEPFPRPSLSEQRSSGWRFKRVRGSVLVLPTPETRWFGWSLMSPGLVHLEARGDDTCTHIVYRVQLTVLAMVGILVAALLHPNTIWPGPIEQGQMAFFFVVVIAVSIFIDYRRARRAFEDIRARTWDECLRIEGHSARP